MLVKIDVLADDETKHMLLFIFHPLYTCVTVRGNMLHKEKKENGSHVSTI